MFVPVGTVSERGVVFCCFVLSVALSVVRLFLLPWVEFGTCEPVGPACCFRLLVCITFLLDGGI